MLDTVMDISEAITGVSWLLWLGLLWTGGVALLLYWALTDCKDVEDHDI